MMKIPTNSAMPAKPIRKVLRTLVPCSIIRSCSAASSRPVLAPMLSPCGTACLTAASSAVSSVPGLALTSSSAKRPGLR